MTDEELIDLMGYLKPKANEYAEEICCSDCERINNCSQDCDKEIIAYLSFISGYKLALKDSIGDKK